MPKNKTLKMFRYRPTDSATGVTRDTAKRIAEHLGVDETQAIHLALRDMALRLLPQYVAGKGASGAQTTRLTPPTAPRLFVKARKMPYCRRSLET